MAMQTILEKYFDPVLPNGLDLIKFKLNFSFVRSRYILNLNLKHIHLSVPR